jgi:tetratricopeptide (TPR) repeat protein
MSYRLLRSVTLLSAVLTAASLSACASPTPATLAGLRPAETGAFPAEGNGAPAQSSSAFGLYLAGEAAIDRGSSRDAASYFGQASRLEPGQDSIRARAFTSALVAGDVTRAAEAAKGLGEGDEPIQRLAQLTVAVEALAEDHGKQAYAALSDGKEGGLQHRQALALLRPWAAAAAGDWAAATAAPPSLGDPVAQGIAELSRAELLERAGKTAEAEALFKSRAASKSGLFMLGYGGFLERQGRRTDAAALYDKAVKDSPNDPAIRAAKARLAAGRPPSPLPSYREGAAEALVEPAAMMVAKREGDSGLAYLRLVLRLDPTLDEAWVLVGDAMNGAGDTDSAKEAYLKVRPHSEQYIAARSRLALLAQQAGDKDGALRLARDMLDVAPNDPRPLVLYADLLRDDERFPEAVQSLSRAIASMGEAEAGWSLFYERGVAEERAGDWTAAEADLKRALKLKPDEPQVLNYLGYAWADRGEHLKEALGMLEKAAALEPSSGAIVDSLGWARYRVRQYHDAARDLERAVMLSPADPEVNSHLGDAYWRTGRQLEARFQWKRVLTLDADAKTKAAAELKIAQGLGPEPAESAPKP